MQAFAAQFGEPCFAYVKLSSSDIHRRYFAGTFAGSELKFEQLQFGSRYEALENFAFAEWESCHAAIAKAKRNTSFRPPDHMRCGEMSL